MTFIFYFPPAVYTLNFIKKINSVAAAGYARLPLTRQSDLNNDLKFLFRLFIYQYNIYIL